MMEKIAVHKGASVKGDFTEVKSPNKLELLI